MSSGGWQWCATIEGFGHILTDGDTDAAVAAYADTDHTSAIGGLFVDIQAQQDLHPYDPFRGGGTARLYVQPDRDDAAQLSDTLGKAVFRTKDGNTPPSSTYLRATADRDDTTITVADAGGLLAAPSEAHIGTECVGYSAKGATTLTVSDRGKYSPFGVDGDLHFAQYHRVGAADYGVPLEPIVSSFQRVWAGRWVEIRLHQRTEGVLDLRASATRVFAGKITDITDDPQTGCTVISLQHVLDVVGETTLMRDQFSARLTEGAYLPEDGAAADRMIFKLQEVDEGAFTVNNASPLVVVASGAANNYEMDAGYYTVDTVLDAVNRWLAQALSDTDIDGTYTWALGTVDGSPRVTCRWSINTTAAFHPCRWRVTMPRPVATLLGMEFMEFEVRGLGDQQYDGAADDPYPMFVGAFSPYRTLFTRFLTNIANGVEATASVSDTKGTFTDQAAMLPGYGADLPAVYPGEVWGIFLVDGKHVVIAAYDSGDMELRHMLWYFPASGEVTATRDNWFMLGRKYDEGDAPIEIKQIAILDATMWELVAKIFASTGTAGYNHATYDELGYGFGLAIPWDLLGDGFVTSLQNLPGADAPLSVTIDKPAKIVDILKSDLILRNAHLVWKGGQLRFACWTSPHASNAVHALTESNKAEPYGNRIPQRSATIRSTAWAKPVLRIEYNREIQTGNYRDSITIENRTAIDDSGGVGEIVTVPARNTWADRAATGAAIEALLPDIIAWHTVFSEPITLLTRSIDRSLIFDIAPGDIATVTDAFARDPESGLRGITARAAVVMSCSWSNGGPSPGDARGDARPYVGEVTVMFVPVDRVGVYAPAAELDDTYSDAGYDNATVSIKVLSHEHSDSTDAADVTHFAKDDKILITEIDPDDPAAPLSWTRTISGAPVGNVITLSAVLGGWDNTKAYRIVSQVYSAAVATQQADAYQADNADGMIENTAPPYLYGAAVTTGARSTEDHTELAERHASASFGDGRPRDVAYDRALLRTVENFLDHKCVIQTPMLEDTARTANLTGGPSGAYQLHSVSEVYLQGLSIPSWCDRYLYVAPYFRSTDGTATTLRVSLCSALPISSSSGDDFNVVLQGAYTSVAFSTSSTTYSYPTALGLALGPVVNLHGVGLAYLVIEYKDKCQTYGLAEAIVRERQE